MAKQTRKEKREEERRVLAELDEAVAKEKESASPQKPQEEDGEQKIYCRRCKSVMQKGVCPTCGYKIYIPMDEGKRKKIRLIVGAISIAVFLVLFLVSRS